MYLNRVDVVKAYYLFFMYYHEGQDSLKYKRLCKIAGYFKPSIYFDKKHLSINGRAIYNNLVKREKKNARHNRHR